MKPFLVIIIFIFSYESLQAQVEIYGKVFDKTKNNNLEGATIQLLNTKDSTRHLTKSDTKGAYKFTKVPTGSYALSSSLIGFKKQLKTIELTNKPLELDFELEPGEILLEEITIAPVPDVAVRGDTMEFNTRNFMTREYADADEMVAQVPGVTIDEEGNVSAHGEPVGRILVDGKEFFSTDPKVALKTLPADIIDKLQIIDEKSEQARFSGFDDGKRTKVINIVTKPDKRKGYFGKVNAGKGDGDKFAFSSSLSSFNGDEKISVNLMANNINETNFAEQGRGGSRRGNNNTDRGLSDTYAAAANYTNTFLSKKLELNGSYNFRNSSTFTNTLSDIEFIMGARANQFQNQHQIADQGHQEHNFKSRIKWDIDSMNRLDISPTITFNTSDRTNSSTSRMSKGESRDLLNTSDRNNSDNNSNFNFGAGLTYMHRFKGNGKTLTLHMDGNKSNNDALAKTLALNEYYKDAILERIDTNDRQSVTYGFGSGINSRISYSQPISRYSRFQMNYGFRTNSNYADRKTLEFLTETGQYEELNERLSNEFRNDFNHHSTGLSYGFNKRDTLRIQVGLNYETGVRVNDRTVPINLKTTANFSSFLPEFSTAYFFTKERNLEFNYNTATNTPSIDQLQDYVDNSNELSIRNGNPNLKQEYSHRLRFQYRDVNRDNGRSMTSNVNYTFTNNKIINATITTDSTIQLFEDVTLGAGGQYIVPENINGVYELRINNNYSLPLKKLGFNLNLNNNLYYNKNFAILNQDLIPNYSYGFSQHVGIFTNFSRKVIIGVNYTVNMRFSENPTAQMQYYHVTNHRLNSRVNLEFFKYIVAGYDMSYIFNGGIMGNPGTPTTLVNASLGYKIFKKRDAVLSFKAFDLLNNATNINRRFNETSISDITSNTLNRYFLLSLTYNLRSFGGRSSSGNQEERFRGPRNRR